MHRQLAYVQHSPSPPPLAVDDIPCGQNTSLPACRACQATLTGRSWKGEDILLQPLLWNASGGQPATFVEIGANDGRTGSNTMFYEKCHGWRGVLIEGNGKNFAFLKKSGRNRSTYVHSAVCTGGPSFLNMTAAGGLVSAAPKYMDAMYSHLHKWQQGHKIEAVPCDSLTKIMADAGYRGATFLSLDVEGAEAEVLKAVDPAVFQVVMVEWQFDTPKNEHVHRLLTRAGLRLHRVLQTGLVRYGGLNRVYVGPRSGAWACVNGTLGTQPTVPCQFD